MLYMGIPTVAERVRTSLPALTPAGRTIARELLSDYPRAGLETISRLAQRADVSAPTVLRFVTSIGYEGFSDFQEQLRRELGERTRSPLQQYDQARSLPEQPEEGPASGQKTVEKVLAEGLLDTFAAIPPESFDQAAELLCHPKRRIITIGGRFSSVLAQYLELHLQLLRPGVETIPDRGLARSALLTDIGKQHVVVAYDFRRHEEDTIAFGLAAQTQGASLIVFTDPWMSPLAGPAKVVFPCSVASPSPFDAFTGAMAVTDALITGVARRLGDTPLARLSRIDSFHDRGDGGGVRSGMSV